MVRKRALSVKTATCRALFVLGMLALTPYLCSGQTALRSVSGRVTDGSGAVIKGAVVQLSNVLTLQVRSYITQADGLYRFHGLHPLIDYNVRAQYEGRWSRSRTVSRFDSKIVVRINVQIPVEDRQEKRDKTIGIITTSLSPSVIAALGSTPCLEGLTIGKEAAMCAEMTKSIDRWENEGGRTEDTPTIAGADNLTMAGIFVPSAVRSCASGHEECSSFA